MKKDIKITKHSGKSEIYDESKLYYSLSKSYASEELKNEIINEIYKIVQDGMSTNEIYKIAFRKLKSKSRVNASRYKLKRAIMELGPSGYAFENFVATILNHEGYFTDVSVIIRGNCVSHEVDVLASKEDEELLIECKYHNTQNQKCDVKIPLYIDSRFHDIEKELKKDKYHNGKSLFGCIYTNTRFTKDAIAYGECAGLKLYGWNYPNDNSLKYRIDKLGLYPLTSLMSLTKAEKTSLLENNIVLCKEIHQNPILLEEIGMSKIRQKKVLADCKILCEGNY